MQKTTEIENIRHSFAHLLAASVQKCYPKAQLGIGPVIENGFYYDFGNLQITDEELPRIEKEMRAIASQDLPFKKELWPSSKAAAHFKKEKQPYKVELIKDLKTQKVGMVYTGNAFLDLCRGGHVKNTKELPLEGFALNKVAGAYWRGDEKNPMLTRVYGLAFLTKKELEEHIRQEEEAQKRDHRKLGKDLGLFTIIDEIGPGLPLFYPKGAVLRRTVENYIIEEQEKRGYVPIWIPHITKGKLYKISGHLDKFDAMYPPMKLKGEDDYYVKPMNCPHFMMLYKTLLHSYRDLPLRYTATTTNYRYEKSGELSGLTRVRALTQDDCHVFCAPEDIESEIRLMLDMIQKVYEDFGFHDFWVRISLRDPKKRQQYIGFPKNWNIAENALRTVIQNTGMKWAEALGEAAFYGPKLDFMMKDVLGREWQLSTIQLDFNLPERFELEYTNSEGKKARPVVIHRAILGSTERFLAILIEHYAGAFPLWLAPEQVWILPISDKFLAFAKKIREELLQKDRNLRVIVREENETLGKKIREGQIQKIPYLVIVGEKEEQQGTISVRDRQKGDLGQTTLEAFSNMVAEQIQRRQ
ncbi:MAG: threonine--tRNA ligase [bacterium]|nr:threonine--tRNA ligase [bacterium]